MFTILLLILNQVALASDTGICNGPMSKYTPRVTVKYKQPDTRRLALDEDAQIKSDRLELIKKYLKKSYFSGYFWDATAQEEEAFIESVGKPHYDEALYALMDLYTFKFPLDLIKSTFHEDREEAQIHFGYDYISRAYKPSLALDGASWMWDHYAWRETTVTQKTSKTGEIYFEVSLDLTLFCKYRVLKSTLLAR